MEFTTVALITALAGTCIQAYWRLRTIRDVELELVQHFNTVRELIEEVPRFRPARRQQRRREVRRALAERPEDLLNYQRVLWELRGWVLLVVASFFALVGAIGC